LEKKIIKLKIKVKHSKNRNVWHQQADNWEKNTIRGGKKKSVSG